MALFWQDSFESATGPDLGGGIRTATGHTNTTEGTQFNTAGDHFVRTNVGQDNSIGFNTPMTPSARGGDGDFYWRSEDVSRSTGSTNGDGTGDGVEGGGQLVWSGIDITGQTGISFDGLFLARSNPFIEATNTLEVSYSIDGGASVVGLRWIGQGAAGTEWAQDTNLDGVIDASDSGATLSQASFTNYSFDIVGTGSTLTLQFDNNDWLGQPATLGNIGGGEEVGIDNFRLSTEDPTPPATDGDENNNVIAGDGDANLINGLGGNDQLFGQGGNDILNGGEGNDALFGGAGEDALDGGNGIDRAYYLFSTSGVEVDLRDVTLNTGDAAGDTYVSIERFYGSNEADRFTGNFESNYFRGNSGNDILVGNNGNDFLFGGGNRDILRGGDDNDVLYGDGGTDDLFGDAGNDKLRGGQGVDTLNGGTGRDLLIGGSQGDVFVFNSGDGRDTIKDFEDGVDTIRFDSGVEDFSGLRFKQGASSAVVIHDGGVIVVQNTLVTDLTADDFEFTPAPATGASHDVAKALSDSAPSAEFASVEFADDAVADNFDASADAVV